MSNRALYAVNGCLYSQYKHTHARTRTCIPSTHKRQRQGRVIHFRFPLTFSLICILHCQHIASPRYVQELSLNVQRMTSFFFFLFLPGCTIINHRLHSYADSSPSRIKRYLPVFPFIQQISLTPVIAAAKGDLWERVGAPTTL